MLFRVTRETLSDGSVAHNVTGKADGVCVTVACGSIQHAAAVRDVLNTCAHIDITVQHDSACIVPKRSMQTIGDICGDALDDRNL